MFVVVTPVDAISSTLLGNILSITILLIGVTRVRQVITGYKLRDIKLKKNSTGGEFMFINP